MKLRKFFGLTSRSVLEQVRVELGADAVIVANHATPDGVEVTAMAGEAIDTLLSGRAPQEAAPEMPAPAADIAQESPGTAEEAPAAIRRRVEPAPTKPDLVPLAPEPVTAFQAETAQSLSAVMAEVASMRELIEQRLALMTFSESLRRRPLAARLTRDLLAAGFSPALARTITERLPDDISPAQARDWVLRVLSRNLACIDGGEEIIARGGVYALIGPTGVGKTTTTAKLAARCAVRYGANRLALISTDSFRIGAQDQLRIYAKILGLAVHTVSDRHDLKQALDAVRGRHLVLIDTVGMSQRDARVAEQSMLLSHPEIRRLLLLNAAAQGETLDEVVDAYGRVPETLDGMATHALAGCIVTKQDEASRQGTALDVAIRHRLPVHYVTSGQRVPEDIFVPTSELLIDRSLRRPIKPSAFTLNEDELPLAIQTTTTAGVAHA
jgi:flagellar biosynthesis protein FlhF